LIEYQEQAYMSKSLATIMLDVPIEYDFGEMAICSPNFDALRALFQELEFRTLGNRILMEMQEQYAVGGERCAGKSSCLTVLKKI